jgi:hypothetical protein
MSDTQMVEDIKKTGELRGSEELFNTAFNYLNNKYKKVNLATCIQALESDDTPQEKRFSVGWAALSLLEKGSHDFEKIKSGLTNKMREKIIKKMC